MNHLPFVLRTILNVPWTPPTTRRTQVKMPALRMGGDGGRAILQDMQITPLFLVYPTPGAATTYEGHCVLRARLGIEGKGYLTEELLPVGLFSNGYKTYDSTWKFARPFRLDPGEKLTARIIHRDRFSASYTKREVPGIMFHGKRVKDDLPIMLYDARDTYVETTDSDDYGTVVNLTGSTLNCPSDSSVLIYSVSSYYLWTLYAGLSPNTDFAPLIQVYGPGGRPWVTAEISTNNLTLGAAIPALQNWTISDWAEGACWIEGFTESIELGEERGWIIDSRSTVLVELENPNNAQALATAYTTGGVAEDDDLMVCVTLRGCLEVPNA